MKNSGNQGIRRIRKRFSRISLKKGFFSILFFIILSVIGSYLVVNEFDLDSSWQNIIISYAVYVTPFLLIIWVLRETNQPFSFIVKGDSDELSQVFIAIPLIIISIGVAWMVILVLNEISAGAADNYLNWLSNTELFKFGPETTLLQYVLFLGMITVVAPVVEEIIFRGIMIERIGAKYNYSWAIVISSVIFGILHSEPVGAFISGVVLSLVYLKTRSLIIPILIHIANNSIASFFIIADETFVFSNSRWETTEPYISNAWVGILLFTAGIGWLSWYLKHNWKNVVEQQGFKLKAEKNE
ncbi:type II CAAX endopeptidase family protein [Fodinibius sp. Rm-B-1B1-1]|uniref:CPBP family intramembrane glutamic endopeptidase n=1 Tax=Fodinibius alkaliphilus TaxID=3140241 RepID=UPI00315A7148